MNNTAVSAAAWAAASQVRQHWDAGVAHILDGHDAVVLSFQLPAKPSLLLESAVLLQPVWSAAFVLACLTWAGQRWHLTAVRRRLVQIAILVLCVNQLAYPFLTLGWAPANRMACGLMSWVLVWKVLDVQMGTADPAFLSSPFALAVYFVVPVEYEVAIHDDGQRRPKRVDWRRALELLWTQACRFASLLAMWWIIAHVPGFKDRAASPGVTVAVREWPVAQWLWPVAPGTNGFLQPLPDLGLTLRSYAEVWLVYLSLSLCMDNMSTFLVLLGLQPTDTFQNPLVMSTSPLDFWGRRWNRLVHGLFKRTVFLPLVRGGVPKAVASLGAFVMSGLFHEYAMAFTNAPLAGLQQLFFISQVPFVTATALLMHQVSGKGQDKAVSQEEKLWWRVLRRVGQFTITNLVLLPFAPLFIEPLRAGGVLKDMADMAPTLVLPSLEHGINRVCMSAAV